MEAETHRYLFTVRQRFNKTPNVDSFYKLQSPSGMSGDEMKVMTTLKPGWESESLKADTQALSGMSLRLRFNSDMFQKVCLVRASCELTAEDLDMHINMLVLENKLDAFLDESTIKSS